MTLVWIEYNKSILISYLELKCLETHTDIVLWLQIELEINDTQWTKDKTRKVTIVFHRNLVVLLL